jgi:hypothetical protein
MFGLWISVSSSFWSSRGDDEQEMTGIVHIQNTISRRGELYFDNQAYMEVCPEL